MKINKIRLTEAEAGEVSPQQAIKDGEMAAKDAQAAENIMDEYVVVNDDDAMIQVLDRKLKANKMAARRGRGFQNVLFVGPAGSGKTGRIRDWANARKLNLVQVLASTMDSTDVGGMMVKSATDPGTAERINPTDLDELDNVANSVLFLDEFNRAPNNVRASLLTLILDHRIVDKRVPGGMRYLKNFLFTIAAVNPVNASYKTYKMDKAEIDRFFLYELEPDKESSRAYFLKQFGIDLKHEDDPEMITAIKGMMKLTDTLLSSPDFRFDNDRDIEAAELAGYDQSLSPRSLEDVIRASGGTKDGLLDEWNHRCNPLKKLMVADILDDYEDVEDEATAALDYDTQSSRFKEVNDFWNKALNSLDIEF